MPYGALHHASPLVFEFDPHGSSPAARAEPAGPHERLPYGAIVHHIRQNLSRRITVNELAAIARLSVFQLCRAFRREHETTPYRLVLEIRILHATRMLTAGTTIAETAFQAGFADQSHFTRHFKRLMGMTPKQYVAQRTRKEAGSSEAGKIRSQGVARRAAMKPQDVPLIF